MDLNKILSIIGDNRRFVSPFEDFSGYCMFPEDRSDLEKLYFEKLYYAVQNAESLLEQAFSDDLFDFYGVNRSKVSSPGEMLAGLIFESFVLVPERQTIECCVSNSEFMFGHFIEIIWDYDWNLQSVWIN